LGDIKAKLGGVGEQGLTLPGGWIEYWKYQVGQPLYNTTPTTSPVSIGYWRGNWYPNIYNDAKAAGLNPPPVPAKGNTKQIEDATIFQASLNELYIKYYDQVKDMTNGWPAVFSKLSALAKADPSNTSPIVGGGTGTGIGGNVGGNIGTPSATSSNTMLYIGAGLLAIGGIYYFMKGKK